MSVSRSLLTIFTLERRSALLSNKCAANYASTAMPHRNGGTKTNIGEESHWESVISEAEKIVGFSTSFLKTLLLSNNDVIRIALNSKKFAHSNHPFLKKVNFICRGKNKIQTCWGLIVCLISKAAGHPNVDHLEKDANGVLRSQRALGELTEMIHISYLIHKSMVNIQKNDNVKASKNFGNKIALLSGDYILANCFEVLAKLRDHDLSELMASTIRDLAEAEFIGRRDSQNNPLPTVPPVDRTDYAVKEWTLRNELMLGSLLAKSCKGTLKLGKHNEEIQEQGYNFGKHLALAWQASRDLDPFISKDRINPFDLCSAPIMFHIEYDPSISTEIDKGLELVSNVDYAKVYDIIISGPGIELTKQLQREHSRRATEILSVFQESDARTALSNIIAAMGDCIR